MQHAPAPAGGRFGCRPAQRLLTSAAQIALACAACSADARVQRTCTDTIFTDDFDGSAATRRVAMEHRGAGPAALLSDGFQFLALDVLHPGSLAAIGSSQNGAYLLAFADGNFDFVFGLARAWGTSPDTLASIRTSDAAITPIGFASLISGDWSGFRQDPLSGTLYAVATTCGSSSALYTINRNTAAVVRLHELVGVPCAVSIAISPHGAMYTVDAGLDELFAVDASSSDTHAIGGIGFDTGVLDMDFDGATGTLYVVALNNSAGRVEMRTIDVQTGGSAFVGVIPVNQFTGFAIENEVVCTP